MEMKYDFSKFREQLTERLDVTARNIGILNNTEMKTTNIAGY